MFDLRSGLTGLILGIAGTPMPIPVGRTLVEYLYNDVALIDINTVWVDKIARPYAMIGVYKGEYRLFLGNAPFWADTHGSDPGADGPCVYDGYDLGPEGWTYVYSRELTETQRSSFNHREIWVSFDLYTIPKETCASYLRMAATEPIPVYASEVNAGA